MPCFPLVSGEHISVISVSLNHLYFVASVIGAYSGALEESLMLYMEKHGKLNVQGHLCGVRRVQCGCLSDKLPWNIGEQLSMAHAIRLTFLWTVYISCLGYAIGTSNVDQESPATVPLTTTPLVSEETIPSVVTPASSLGQPSSPPVRLAPSVIPVLEQGCKKRSKDGRCEPVIPGLKCFGAELPYNFTSSDISGFSQQEAAHELKLWEPLKKIPKCWNVIQPFLCSVYFPKCTPGNPAVVHYPSQELCRITRGPCRMVANLSGWPAFLACENPDGTSRFASQCKNELREVRFNTTASSCPPLMVPTRIEAAWYPGVDGCSWGCHDPYFSEEDHESMQHFVKVCGGFCLAANVFAVLTFLFDWKAAKKYPAVLVLYVNICWGMICIGFLAQFSRENAEEDIVCTRDHLRRSGEPRSGENFLCIVVFVLIYYFTLAALVWFVFLSYSWFMNFRALGKVEHNLERRAGSFHLAAWSIPLVFTIIVFALGLIDGYPLTGVCFLGGAESNPAARLGLLLAPVSVCLLASGFFLIRSLVILARLKYWSQEVISPKAHSKLTESIIRLSICLGIFIAAVVFTHVYHVYEWGNIKDWDKSNLDYLVCLVNSTNAGVQPEIGFPGWRLQPEPVGSFFFGGGSSSNADGGCRRENGPSLMWAKLYVGAVFAAGLAMASWVWTKPSLRVWKRFWHRVTGREEQEPTRLKKHKMIAQAFAKRNNFNYAGRISISFHSSHEDPVGLNFDLNSVSAGEISSAWAAAIPQFLQRRYALAGPSVFSRRGSLDSEYSASHRRWSFESRLSRRHSLDSNMSLRVSEMENGGSTATAARVTTMTTTTRKLSRFRRHFGGGAGDSSWRGSITSADSNMSSQILPAIVVGDKETPLQSPLASKRRGTGALVLSASQRSRVTSPPYKPPRKNPPSLGASPAGKKSDERSGPSGQDACDDMNDDHRELLSKLERIAQAGKDEEATTTTGKGTSSSSSGVARRNRRWHRGRSSKPEKVECGTDVPLLDDRLDVAEEDDEDSDASFSSIEVETCDAYTQTCSSDFPSPEKSPAKGGKRRRSKPRKVAKSITCDVSDELRCEARVPSMNGHVDGNVAEAEEETTFTTTTTTTAAMMAPPFPFMNPFSNGHPADFSNFGHRVDRLLSDFGSNVVVRRMGAPSTNAIVAPQVLPMHDISPARLNFDRRSQKNFAKSPDERLMAV